MRIILLALALVALVAPVAEAQKRCTKGIPCGNSCIAANKTCRIGSSAPAPKIEEGRIAKSDSARPDTATYWVASSRGITYYRPGCVGATGLAVANRITFKTEEEAKKAGYRRSTQNGC